MEIQWKSSSITTPTPCLRYVPRLTPCGKLRFVSEIGEWISCLPLPTCTISFIVSQNNFLQYKLQRSLVRGPWVCFHRPPSPTPTQGLKVQPSVHVGSERPDLLLWLSICTCSSKLWSLYRIIHSTQSQREYKCTQDICIAFKQVIKSTLLNIVFTVLLLWQYFVSLEFKFIPICPNLCSTLIVTQRHTVSSVFKVCLQHQTSMQSVIDIHGTFRLRFTELVPPTCSWRLTERHGKLPATEEHIPDIFMSWTSNTDAAKTRKPSCVINFKMD